MCCIAFGGGGNLRPCQGDRERRRAGWFTTCSTEAWDPRLALGQRGGPERRATRVAAPAGGVVVPVSIGLGKVHRGAPRRRGGKRRFKPPSRARGRWATMTGSSRPPPALDSATRFARTADPGRRGRYHQRVDTATENELPTLSPLLRCLHHLNKYDDATVLAFCYVSNQYIYCHKYFRVQQPND